VELPEDGPAACLEQCSGLVCPPESQEQREAGIAVPHLSERLKQPTSRSYGGREAAPMGMERASAHAPSIQRRARPLDSDLGLTALVSSDSSCFVFFLGIARDHLPEDD
jgi:hypothetical protein